MIKLDLSTDDVTAPSGWRTVAIARHQAGIAHQANDDVAEEWPVALVYNGISHAVMMTTPRDLELFAIGFSLSEGIIRDASDIRDIDTVFHEDSAEVHLTLLQGAFVGLKDRRRAMAGRTGCGVCGIESLDLLDLAPEQSTRTLTQPIIADAAIQRAASGLRARQWLMKQTGGVHAAAWCNAGGEIVHVFEDVGRHNALDKLIGALVVGELPRNDGFVFLSSRASYELVRKSARVGIPMVATISAPTSLAIRIAAEAGIRLLSFCRDDSFVEYAIGSAPVTTQ